jgi:formylglycine-generating enzyme required for sulfatase activity
LDAAHSAGYVMTETPIIVDELENRRRRDGFVLIPGGEFSMGGDRFYPEQPVHKVRISKAFEMGKYQVTQEQWQAVMGNNPSYFTGANLPVEMVSWNDVQEFIKKLNAKKDGYSYRLPTEAEWEYACRAGTTGNYAGNLDDMAWYDKNSGGKTHPVGQKKPNAWGCTICTGMCGSGVVIVMMRTTTSRVRVQIRAVRA